VAAHRTAGRYGEALPFGEGKTAVAADRGNQVKAKALTGSPGQMLQMLIHLFFRNGQELGELQGRVRLLLEQLFQGLAYRHHVQPAISEGFAKIRPDDRTIAFMIKIL
jgi:hypothetical protein